MKPREIQFHFVFLRNDLAMGQNDLKKKKPRKIIHQFNLYTV